MRLFGAILLAAASPAAAEQFDLLCSGTEQPFGQFHSEPIARRYHVDLDKKQWCYNECTIKPITEVNPSQIVFDEQKAAYRGDQSARLDYVDRTTGKWSFVTSYWSGDGVCQRAPFTGFPAPATKF
jgi:hypothetical protein